jgi:hypothetical protein
MGQPGCRKVAGKGLGAVPEALLAFSKLDLPTRTRRRGLRDL